MLSWKGARDPALDNTGRLEKLKEIALKMAEPWKSELLWIPDGTPVADNSISYWVTTRWDNLDGKVTLAGDAAHPMPPRKCRI
jgi:2-polyprenyl-6-methoxyphenol hydroxylase-like FAD-dependent oxidoreductase